MCRSVLVLVAVNLGKTWVPFSLLMARMCPDTGRGRVTDTDTDLSSVSEVRLEQCSYLLNIFLISSFKSVSES
jgi:hypothetical protein